MAPAGRQFFRATRHGIDLYVRLTPRAAEDSLGAVGEASDGSLHLTARVRAVPDRGLANEALVKLLAASLGISQRDITLAAGATSRLKTLRIDGDPDALAARIATLTAVA